MRMRTTKEWVDMGPCGVSTLKPAPRDEDAAEEPLARRRRSPGRMIKMDREIEAGRLLGPAPLPTKESTWWREETPKSLFIPVRPLRPGKRTERPGTPWRHGL